jgi:hypothetical protein
MIPDFAQQLADLKRQTVAALRDRYAELLGEPTRAGNRVWLIKRIAWRLQALAEGDLSQRARQRAAELTRDADLRLCAPRALLSNLVEVDLSKKGRSTRAHDPRLPPPLGKKRQRIRKKQARKTRANAKSAGIEVPP